MTVARSYVLLFNIFYANKKQLVLSTNQLNRPFILRFQKPYYLYSDNHLLLAFKTRQALRSRRTVRLPYLQQRNDHVNSRSLRLHPSYAWSSSLISN